MSRPRGRPRNMENVFTPPKSNVQFSEGQKSKGILDDYAIRKNLDTQEGTIQSTPLSGKDLVNKEYVDAEISGVGLPKLNEVLNPDASKTFNFGNNKYLTFSSVDRTPIADEGIFNWEAKGAFTGDVCHIHQHTGNAGAGTVLLHLEAEDSDICPLKISGECGISIDANANIVTTDTLSGTTISVQDGTIQHTPTNAKDVATKEYVDASSGAAGLWKHTGTNNLEPISGSNMISGTYLEIMNTISGTNIYASGIITGAPIASISAVTLLNTTHRGLTNEHLDWEADGVGTIHENNYTDNDTTDHTALSNIGTITHAAVEAELASISGITLVNTAKVSYTDATQFQTLSGDVLTNEAELTSISAVTLVNTAHIADASDPHGATLAQTNINSSGDTSMSGAIISGDFETMSGAYIANIVFGTGATPPTASGFTRGTIYVQYTP